jgi:hypothetical protein
MVVGSPTEILKLGACAARSRGTLNCLVALCPPSLAAAASLISALISKNVVGGALRVVESSFAGGGGGGETTSEVEGSPRGPRGSDSMSRVSRRVTSDCARREPGGRRREEIGEARGAGRSDGVEADMEDVGLSTTNASAEVAAKALVTFQPRDYKKDSRKYY